MVGAHEGVVVDRVPADFTAGVVEDLVAAVGADHDLVFVEGQASLTHRAYSGVTLSILHGSWPDAVVLADEPARDGRTHFEAFEVEGVEKEVRLIEDLSDADVVSLSTWADPEPQAERYGLPATNIYHEDEAVELLSTVREGDVPLSALFGGQPSPVEMDLTIPILPTDTAAERAADATERGFDHLKIKTGNDVAADVERVAAVARAAPNATLKVDANQGWTPKETTRFSDEVTNRGIDLELIEQPVPAADIVGLAQTRERVDVPIAADEAVFTPADATRVVREAAADVINV